MRTLRKRALWAALTILLLFLLAAGILDYSFKPAGTPLFSAEGGFYSEEFDLTLTSEPGTVIHYTLDGSTPTAASAVYTGPIRIYNRCGEPNVYRSIKNVTTYYWEDDPNDPFPDEPVDKCMVVRAVAVGKAGQAGDVVTKCYFVNMPEYENRTVLCVTTDVDDMFGPNGIYSVGQDYENWYAGGCLGDAPTPNFNKSGDDWEIEGTLQFNSPDTFFIQNVGVRISGSSARGSLLKRLGLFARRKYSGSNVFDGQLFEGTETHSVQLRSGFSDNFLPTLLKGLPLACQGSRTAVLFLNGEFWYDRYLLQRLDSAYFEQYWGMDEDDLVLIKANRVGIGKAEDISLYDDLYRFVEGSDFSDPESYEEFCQMADIQSYIDFMASNIYFDNVDFSDHKNVLLFRSRSEGSGPCEDTRWRWCLYDLDALDWNDEAHWQELYGVSEHYMVDTFHWTSGHDIKISPSQQTIFSALKANPDFCRRFINSFLDLANTRFQPEYVREKMDEFGVQNEKVLNFFENRAEYILPCLAEEFGCSGTLGTLTLSVSDPEAGTVQLTAVSPDFSSGSWQGSYFTDCPVSLTAVPAEGYRFAGWQGDCTDTAADITVTVPESGAALTAVFEKIS